MYIYTQTRIYLHFTGKHGVTYRTQNLDTLNPSVRYDYSIHHTIVIKIIFRHVTFLLKTLCE